MARHIILAQSDCTAAALNAWLELIGEKPLKKEDDARVVWQNHRNDGEQSVLAYESLVKRIEAAAKMSDGSIALNDVIVLVDNVSPSQLNAISESGGWHNLIALLILTFPEIKWVFGLISKDCREFPSEDHDLKSLLNAQRRDPLLDPTKLREWVRQRTVDAKDKAGKQITTLPLRRKTAAAIDDEKSYAYFHAYVAWRFGFRADAITGWELMSRQFGKEAKHGYSVLLEDMSLNFPDKPADKHVSDLHERGTIFKALDSTSEREHSDHRILVTTGHDQNDRELLKKNGAYLEEKRNKHGRGKVVFKPAGGMLDLWNKAELFRYLHSESRRGNAEGFIWPPPSSDLGMGNHSAPGRLMLIAETLLRRAEVFRASACTVKDFIKGAVLATEAAELLGGRTPTLTLAALALKHEYETRAECAFVGVGYHFDVKGRRQEIAQEVRAVARWFVEDERRSTELDARVVIMNRLAVVFRAAGQFEEENHALVEVRRLHRKLDVPKTCNPIAWTAHWMLGYAEWLMEKPPRFLWVIAVWIVFLSYIWLMLSPDHDPKAALSGTVGAFFGGNPAEPNEEVSVPLPLLVFSCFATAAGVFHIGVFISYLYSLISRR